jgi:AraC-like DNA-binding protein
MRADPVNALRVVIQRLIPEGRSGIGSAARIVGMSVRTLQRRLAETGVSYSDLVDEVRLASALALIDDRSIKFSEIARKLGYADAANFDRAFRRWTGHSPSQVRAFDRKSRIDLAKMRTSNSFPPPRSDWK